MDDSNDSGSLSSLLCEETKSCFEDDDDRFSSAISNTEDEYISLLFDRECSFRESHGCYCLMVENWKKCDRFETVRWILETRAFFNFRFETAYLSVTYMDRFLSRRTTDGQAWAIQLLSVACLSLAAKMEECKVVPLSKYPDNGYNFGAEVIQRMEFLVLNILEWKMSCVTPFSFLNYFITKFSNNSRPRSLLSMATNLILATAEVMHFMDYCPSVIAAAAVLTASDQRLTKESMEFKISSITSFGSIETEHVFSCYNLMQELETGKWKVPKTINSPDLASIHSSSVDDLDDDDLDDASFNPAGTKRRKLI